MTRSRSSSPTHERRIRCFLVLGIQHIWTGYDHLLFLGGLLIVGALQKNTRCTVQ